MGDVDVWREDVLALLQALSEPLQVLVLLAAFTLGILTVRAVA